MGTGLLVLPVHDITLIHCVTNICIKAMYLSYNNYNKAIYSLYCVYRTIAIGIHTVCAR